MKMKPHRQKSQRRPSKKTNSTECDPVEVYCRIRPIDETFHDKCVTVVSNPNELYPTTIQISPPESSLACKNGQYKESQYTFKLVFDECTSQKSLFDQVAYPLVDDLVHGRNGILFAYGITSSGKTHTMTGTPQDEGILPRCLDVLFNSVGQLQAKKYVFKPDKMNGFEVQTDADAMVERQRKDLLPKLMPHTPGVNKREKFDFVDGARVRDQSTVPDVDEDNSYAVFVSYIEIYNNYVYDLLEELPYDPITGTKPPQSKILREDSMHFMYVHGCTEVEVKTPEEAFDVLLKGQKRRKVAYTALNAESSRSHSVFNIRLVQAPLDPVGEEVLQDKNEMIVSQLSLVDLAGSERCGRTKNSGDRLKEASNINQALMTLRMCIECLRENQQNGANKKVPYRESRITHLFKNYFEGEGKVRMVVCVNPKAEEYDETLHVMRFAELTQEVQIARSVQVKQDHGLAPGRRKMNLEYKEAAERLRVEGVDPENVLTPITCKWDPFPDFELRQPEDTETLTNLVQYLHERHLKRMTLMAEYNRKRDRFRSMLLDTESGSMDLKVKLAEVTSQLNEYKKQVSTLDKRNKYLEQQNKKLISANQSLSLEIKDLHDELEEQGFIIEKTQNEKNRLKRDCESKLMIRTRQLERDLEKQKNELEQRCMSRLAEKNRTINLMKNIVNSESTSSDNQGHISTPSTSSTSSGTLTRSTRTKSSSDGNSVKESAPATLPKPKYGTPVSNFKARSETNLSGSGSSGYGRRTNTTTRLNARAKSPPARGIPMNNARRHRRSKSTGDDLTLFHQDATHVPVGTVLQPRIRKSRSITKLTVKDTQDASKYIMTHQEADSQGELETQLYMGDVIPTAGGGASVVFTGMEILKQASPPGDRKRRVSQPVEDDGDHTDTETRCSVAIEGHNLRKRSKQSDV